MTYRAAAATLLVCTMYVPVIPAARSESTQAPPPPKCNSAEHRQFDFWLGEWDVTTPDGKTAGRNSITRTLDDCVIHEHWVGVSGMRGESFNMWDRDQQRWHQTWVNTRGQLLVLQGTVDDGSMRLVGESGPATGRVMNRITWTPQKDGGVRQVWEVSSDRGKTWNVAFDGRYRRRR